MGTAIPHVLKENQHSLAQPGIECCSKPRYVLGTLPYNSQAGIWPAFWASGKDIHNGIPWPECGEWDIFENAHGVDYTLASVHYDPHGGGELSQGGQKTTFVVEEFHTFAVKVNRSSTGWRQESLQ